MQEGKKFTVEKFIKIFILTESFSSVHDQVVLVLNHVQDGEGANQVVRDL